MLDKFDKLNPKPMHLTELKVVQLAICVMKEFANLFLLRDAMRKRGLCCRPVTPVSVCLSRSCIASTRLKISSNFFLAPVAPSF